MKLFPEEEGTVDLKRTKLSEMVEDTLKPCIENISSQVKFETLSIMEPTC